MMNIKRFWTHLTTSSLLRDRAYSVPLGLGILAQIALWGLLWYYRTVIYHPQREFLALHYKVQYGIDFLAPWYYIFAIPLLGILVMIMNVIVARYGHLHERFGMYIALMGAAAVQVILTWALYLIIQVNIF
ncbi:MAG: hypothetical protein Q8P11_04215 [bacterium]|nr:hypothetical protein [bacterium]